MRDYEGMLRRMLQDFGGYYTLEDILVAIDEGRMQSFSVNDTWIVTQVLKLPRRKVLEISFVVGDIADAVEALPRLYEFARSIGATRITATGRDGWWKHAEAGWDKVGSMYAKELYNGRQ